MKIRKRRLIWCALWMAVIFLFSAQTSQRSRKVSEAVVDRVVSSPQADTVPSDRKEPDRERLNVVVRKGAHLAEYAVLAMLLANVFWDSDLPNRMKWLLPVAISALYAVTDEVHQYFVPGRACRLEDMGIDTCGAILGMCLFAGLAWLWKKIRKQKACCL